MHEWVAQYLRPNSWLFWTKVPWNWLCDSHTDRNASQTYIVYIPHPYTLGRLLELVAVRLPSPFTQTSGKYRNWSSRSGRLVAGRQDTPKLLHGLAVVPNIFFTWFCWKWSTAVLFEQLFILCEMKKNDGVFTICKRISCRYYYIKIWTKLCK